MYNRNSLFARATFTGTIIGSGIFALPYVASQSGYPVFLIYFLVVGVMMISLYLLYGQVITATPGLHRFPGYAEKYLGLKAKRLAFFTSTFGLLGTMLSYLIIGGHFLHGIFNPLIGGEVIIYILLYFMIGAYLIFRDARTVARAEIIMLIFLFGLVLLFLITGAKHIEFTNFTTEAKNIFLPFGVLIFSLSGMAVVPEMKDILKDKAYKLKKIIILGVVSSILIYLLFTFLVWGISGENTSAEAIPGLKNTLGQKVILFGYIFGFLATFTSFITIGLEAKKMFWYDFGVPKNFSWFFVCFIPLSLYLLGFRSLVNVIGVTGAFMLGLEGILIFILCLKAKKISIMQAAYQFKIPDFLKYLFIVLFIIGIVFEIINLLKG